MPGPDRASFAYDTIRGRPPDHLTVAMHPLTSRNHLYGAARILRDGGLPTSQSAYLASILITLLLEVTWETFHP